MGFIAHTATAETYAAAMAAFDDDPALPTRRAINHADLQSAALTNRAGRLEIIRSRLRLARHVNKVRPYAWRSIHAEALTIAGIIRRSL